MIPALVTVMLAMRCSFDNPEFAGSGSETICGFVIDQRSGTGAANARITLFFAGDIDTAIVDTVRSDNLGRYAFNKIHQGTYRLLAKSADTITVLVKKIQYTESSKLFNAGTDTLKLPGSLGAALTGADLPAAKAFCYLRNTPYFDVSDDSGRVQIEKIPPGSYTLRIVPDNPFAIKDTVITIVSGAVCNLGIIALKADPRYPPPEVQQLKSAYDTAHTLVILSWKAVVVSDLAGYVVYRRTASTSFEKISSILLSTSYDDSVFSDTTGVVFIYAVKAVDSGGTESVLFSNTISVQTVSSAAVKTRSVFTLVGQVNDTLSTGDTVTLSVRFENPTRINRRVEWFADSLASPLRSVVVSTRIGTDTLELVWGNSVNQKIIIQCTDEKGDPWRDTTTVNVNGILFHPGSWTRINDAPFTGPVTLCGTSGRMIYIVARRYDAATRIYSLFSYDTRKNLWDTLSDCPTNREGTGCALFRNAIYVAGGVTVQGMVTNALEIFDLASQKWSQGPSVWTPMKDIQLITSNDRLYLLGGYHDKWYNRIDQYDTSNRWKEITYMISDRSLFAIAQEKGLIYPIGGQRFSAAINGVEVFNPAQALCSGLAPMRFKREGAAATAVNGFILVFGGTDNSAFIDTCELYDPGKNRWYSITTMKTPRYSLAAASVDGLVYVIGGINKQGQSVGIVERYSP